MIEFSRSLKSNEFHVVDSTFNEDSKNVNFFQGGPNFAGGPSGKFMENGDIYCYANRGGQFRKRISAPAPWYQNPCDASIFFHARPNFRGKNEKT